MAKEGSRDITIHEDLFKGEISSIVFRTSTEFFNEKGRQIQEWDEVQDSLYLFGMS